jgi:hypothetical protein
MPGHTKDVERSVASPQSSMISQHAMGRCASGDDIAELL